MDNLIESLERDKQMIFGLRLNRIAEDIDKAIELLKEQQQTIEKLGNSLNDEIKQRGWEDIDEDE